MSVPKLRFPEFSDAGEWEEKKLGDIAPLQRGFDLPTYNLETGSIPVVYSNGIQNYHKEGMAKAPGLVTGRSGTIGKLHFIEAGDYWPHNTALWVTSFKHNIPKFVYFLYLVIGMERFASGSGVPTLNRNYVHAFETCIPLLPEQKKIADCLSSLDDRITAETQKLDTLKAHKKGLMQQLFPAEGETLPKLRFPEFHKSGEWEEKSIQDLIDKKIIIGHLDGNHGALYPRAEEFSKEGVPYISANDFITGHIDFNRCKYISVQRALQFKKGVAKDGDILFAHNATVGPVAKLSTNFQFVILSTTATYFRCNQKYLINDFLKFALSSPSFVKQYTSVMSQSTRNQVPITTQRKFNLQIPSIQEQQKIADCLTSINEAIAAQSQAIELLKLHKKGLMQQLFPSVEEVKR
ncbi:MAG: restriction endonuclease subunit S [Pseudanabaena sp.]